ncbi:hypothetical protein D3C76_1006050 [compost metagenome]
MLHSENDSPLSDLLHQKFGILAGEDTQTAPDKDAHLHVSISKGSLSALYTYQAAVIALGLPADKLDKIDIITGISPRHFLSLADLLQSQLPLDKNPEYVACHNAAMQYASETSNREKLEKFIF